MTSPTDVANLALDQIGARFLITSLSPPSPPPNANVVARQYQLRMDSVSRAAHWNCCRRQGTLTLLKAAVGTPENPEGADYPVPPVPYQYEYLYPPDCLKARYLLANPPNDAAVGTPIFPAGLIGIPGWWANSGYQFAVAIDTDADNNQRKVILTDLEYAQLVYTARVDNPDLWDPHFMAAVCATLGAWLVRPLQGNAETLKEQIQIASSVILQARISDGNEGVTSIDATPDWLAVRGTAVSGDILGPYLFAPWDSLGFPGGALI